MARVSFSPLVEEIIGKLAGSVFQDSYGGFQIRTRVSPRNPQSTYQQLRRGEFGFLSASWRGLSSTDRQSFIDNAASPSGALNLFLQANVNLTLIKEPPITFYVPSSDPGTMQLEFVSVDPTSLLVIATGSPTTVPAGTKLLLQVTALKAPTKIFTNPSQYSPVISFDEGTDLSSAVDIISAWTARYGIMLADKRLCLKTALIDKSNGLRGADLINCTNSEEMAKFVRINSNFADQATAGTAVTDAYAFAVPANTLVNDGDTLRAQIWGDASAVGGTVTIGFDINGSTSLSGGFSATQPWFAEVLIVKSGANLIRISLKVMRNAGVVIESIVTDAAETLTAIMNTKWTIQCTTSGTVTARAALMNKELI